MSLIISNSQRWQAPTFLGSLVLLSAVLLVPACARFHPEPLSASANAVRLESRTLTNSNLKAFLEENIDVPAWPVQEWDFDTLTMAALYYHPSLEVARAQWDVARGGETTAGARPNPTLNVTPGYNFTTLTPSPWLPLGSIDVPIETAGKRTYRKARAGHLSAAARFSVVSAAWQVRKDLRAALLDFTAAERRTRYLREQLQSREQLLERLEQQVQAGAMAGSELLNWRVAVGKARVDLADNERLWVDARTRIAIAMGVPVRALDGVKLAYSFRTDESRAAQLSSIELRRLALQTRPDILAALQEYAAAESALQLEIARQYPDLRIAPGYEYDQGDSKWSLGLTVDLPILNQNQGPIAEARAKRTETAARFKALQAHVLAELDRATELLKITARNSSALREVADEQRKRRDAVAAQLQAGATDRIELLNAELELATTELAAFEGEIKLQQAFGDLEDAVQHPFEIPEKVLRLTGSSNAF